MRAASILTLVLLAGCASANRGGDWPSLAPRAGELSPLVPRNPLGPCAACGQDVFATPVVPPPTALPPAPADAAARLAAIEAALVEIEREFPAQRRAAAAAIAAAAGKAADSNAATDAEVQRSRLEALFQPLARQAKALDALEDDLTGKADAGALLTRLTTLRDRLDKLDADRAAVSGL